MKLNTKLKQKAEGLLAESPLLDRVSVTRQYIHEAGSCCACGRHPRFDNDAPETVREIMVGDHSRCTSSIRLCDQCWSNLLLKANGV